MRANQMTHEQDWLAFVQAGHDIGDLEAVIEHSKVLNKEREEKFKVALELGRLIGDLTKFSDRLCSARAWAEAGRPLGKTQQNGHDDGIFAGRSSNDAYNAWKKVHPNGLDADFMEVRREWEDRQ